MPNAGVAQILLLGTLDAAGVLAGVTAAGSSIPIDRSNYLYNTVTLRGVGTIGGGTVLIEEADWMPTEVPYTGTWSVLSTVAATTLTGGAELLTHLAASAYGFIRVRVSAPITGGGSVAAIMRSAGN